MTTTHAHASTLIVGAGLTGSLVAHGLAAAGETVLVLDKGRGPGGRLSVRRTESGSFAHGCPLAATAAWVDALPAAHRRNLGLGDAPAASDPRVHALPKHLLGAMLEGRIEARFGMQVADIQRAGGLWQLRDADRRVLGEAQRLVLTAPPPQSAALLSELQPEWCARLRALELAPNWSVLLARDAAQAPPDWAALRPSSARVLAQEVLPGPDAACLAVRRWVVQLDAAFSVDLLEAEPSQVLEAVLGPLGLQPSDFRYAGAHRWRYARVLDPLPDPILLCETTALAVCGDAFAAATPSAPGHADLARCAASAAALLDRWRPRTAFA